MTLTIKTGTVTSFPCPECHRLGIKPASMLVVRERYPGNGQYLGCIRWDGTDQGCNYERELPPELMMRVTGQAGLFD